MARFFTGALLLLFVTACSDLFEYHPNEIRLDAHEKDLTQKNLNRLSQQSPSDTVRFILMGDTQRFYDELQDFVATAATYQVDFILHTGDIADFGMAQEYKWVHELMQKLPQPYLTAIGNHDLLANGPAIYEQMFGPQNYDFTYGNFQFVILNTNGREYNFNGSIPDIGWLRQTLSKSANEAIVIGHIPPYDGDFDPALENKFARQLKESNKVKLALFGHKHSGFTGQPYNDDITYHVAGGMKEREFSIITLAKDYQHVEVANF